MVNKELLGKFLNTQMSTDRTAQSEYLLSAILKIIVKDVALSDLVAEKWSPRSYTQSQLISPRCLAQSRVTYSDMNIGSRQHSLDQIGDGFFLAGSFQLVECDEGICPR